MILTESWGRHVAEVFRINQRLREVLLETGYPDEKAMELLCNGLKHPQCTIEILRLYGMIQTESWGRHVAEVFRTNQRLRELHLKTWYPNEKAMELLCDGLKHPQCTIETLSLNTAYIIRNGKWNETYMVESPASTQVRVEESGKLRVLAEHKEAQN
ncbi:ribonuclease inhibitor-like [Thamnophis elegans]|uniref:ribonuclease inhibitor-like n=1 Tax=Thamnophis elegans TaxID=35005 RepID=UPI001378DE18|nr:ribonuclease inhibitor-like [Thamnophis elegans]